MLNIYVGKENIPKDKKFVYDVEAYWSQVGIPDNIGSRYILNNFEHVEYESVDRFKSRDGKIIDGFYLSTGTKALLEIYNSNKVINGLELSNNAFEFMITHLNGNVYFDDVRRFRLPKNYIIENISVNGTVYKTELELENAIWKD